MKAFWAGFEKLANPTGSLDGGGGFFSGIGKGNLAHFFGRDEFNGTRQGYGRGGGEDTRTDKTLLDRERNPRDYSVHELGPELQNESIPHIRY